MGLPESIKPYRVVARIKNNRLWRAILERWPDVTGQSDAARRLGTDPSTLGSILNMTKWPGDKKKLDSGITPWTLLAERISLALYKDPEYLFDPAFYNVGTPSVVSLEVAMPEIERRGLLAITNQQELELPKHEMVKWLATLSPRQEQILRLYYGIEPDQEHTIDEIAERFCITRSRIDQIRHKALNKLNRIISSHKRTYDDR